VSLKNLWSQRSTVFSCSCKLSEKTYFRLPGMKRYKTQGKWWLFCQILTIVPALPVLRSYSRFKLMTYFSAARDEEIQNTRKMLAVLPETNWFMRFQSLGATVDLNLWLIFLLPGMRRYKTHGKCWQFCQRLTGSCASRLSELDSSTIEGEKMCYQSIMKNFFTFDSHTLISVALFKQ